MNSPTPSTIILAAGGTGGHVFPAIALAEELLKRGFQPVLLTDKRCQAYITAKGQTTSFPTYVIPSATPTGGIIGYLKAAVAIGQGILKARRYLKDLRPQVVIGFGGYPAFPPVCAAIWHKIPTLIHEQNSVCGRVNSWLAPYVSAIATSFPEMSRIAEKDRNKIILTGNPVRAAIRHIHDLPYPALLAESELRLLVIGGSQGASIFSQVIPEAMALLPLPYRVRIRISQQCRMEDIESVRKRYSELGIAAELAPFFNDIPTRLAESHLVISRAGASSLAELTTAGKPSILVPYPYATDNHQWTNAQAIEQAEAGFRIAQENFTADAVARHIKACLENPQLLENAAKAAKSIAIPQAVEKLADAVQALCKR